MLVGRSQALLLADEASKVSRKLARLFALGMDIPEDTYEQVPH